MNSINELKQIRSMLRTKIEKLLEMDSFWKICNPCSNNGNCCIGADISIYEIEWDIISELLKQDNELEKMVYDNYLLNKYCSFYSSELDKCAIHNERPLNCRYTPYQCIIDKTQTIRYSDIVGNCKSFQSWEPTVMKCTDVEYIKILEYNDTVRHYLFLNKIDELPREGARKLSFHLKLYFDQ